ncbi:hypothetical protein HN51_001454 [Arachis hypogaea]
MAYLGPHFHPNKMKHGAPGDQICHAGDLGNIVANAYGVAEATIVDNQIPLIGPNLVVGRALVVHELEDDLGKGGKELSLSTGNAGGRLACGVVGLTPEKEAASLPRVHWDGPLTSILALSKIGTEGERRGCCLTRVWMGVARSRQGV